ncbi:MAG: 2-oxoacid:acceptor oxidoreductase subunit alpha [Candidatus Bilamarchaeaceae archaeon]
MKLTFRIGAQAGAGVMVTGRMLGRCFTRGGYNVLAYPEYPSLIRGGHNVYQVIISDDSALSPETKCDVLLALNKDAIFYHKDAVRDNGIIIYDKAIDVSQFKIKDGITLTALPIAELLAKIGANVLMANALQIGAALAAIDYPLEVFEAVLKDEFERKGEAVVKQNIAVARAGYEYIRSTVRANKSVKPLSKKKKIFLTGNEAIALGAVSSGMKFYAAYPMTPASSILHYLCEKEREFGIIVKQTEDEISAVNEAVGASFAGVRAATGTSGGGFALKTETVGLAGMSETPLVIFLAQRIGPSTGMPTWTEQADLRFALHSGQGDFLRILLAPGDVNEAFELAGEAFNLAEKYQLPVILLTDKFLSESIFTTEGFKEIQIERGKIVKNIPRLPPEGRYKRYAITGDGVSPRPLPGTPNGMHVASSYEHNEIGFSTELFSERKAQVDKRAKKLKHILRDIPPPKTYGKESADATIVAWGSMKMPALAAIQRLRESGKEVNLIHFSYIFPIESKVVRRMFKKANKTILIENNSTAQFGGLLAEYCKWKPNFTILKYTGRPIYAEEIIEEVNKLIDSGFRGKKVVRLLDKEDLEYYNTQRYGL